MINLKPMSEEDRDQVLLWRNLPEVRKWMYTDHVICRKEHDRWFDQTLRDKSRHNWVILWHGVGVGVASVSRAESDIGMYSLGIYIADAAARGSGLSAGVLTCICEQVFDLLNGEKLIAEAISVNRTAIRAYERFGFKQEGYLSSHVVKEDGPHDVVILGLLKDEWEKIRASTRVRSSSKGQLADSTS